SCSERLPSLRSTARNAWSARMRVKSLTPPLPSVLPITAITSSAANVPALMHASIPEASITVFNSTLETTIAMPSNSLRGRALFQHFEIARSAIDHAIRRTTFAAHFVAQRSGRSRIDPPLVRIAAGDEHDAVGVARCRRRHPALDDILAHQLRLALEWVTPSAA